MLKFIPGKQVLIELDIRDFQLLELVKKSLLQPYYKETGKPKPPPDIFEKLLRLEIFRFYLGQHWNGDRIFIVELSYLAKRDRLEKQTKNLEKELSQIDDIYSWKNYSLPHRERFIKKELKNLVDSLFLEEEVQKLNKEHGLQYQKESQAPDTSIEKDSQELTGLKKEEYLKDPKLIETLKRARAEADFLYDNLLTFKRGRGFDERVLEDPELEAPEDALNVLKDETIKAFTQQKEKFKWVKENHLKNRAIYEISPGKERRDFIGKLLQTVCKAYYPDHDKLWGDYERLYKLSQEIEKK